MPLTTYDIIPDNLVHPDTIGFYPMTFGGTIKNTYDRMRETAERVGHPLILAELTGQDGSDINGQSPREALDPQNLPATSQYYLDELAPLVEEYPIRLGIGHSLGGIIIASMLARDEFRFGASGDERIFNGVNHVDGINLRSRTDGTQLPITGYPGFLAYQAKDAALQRASALFGHKVDIPERYDPKVHGVPPEGPSLIENMQNVGPLMRSPASRKTAMELAKIPDLPAYIVGLEHGLSGPEDRVRAFFVKLRMARQEVDRRNRQNAINVVPAAPLETKMEPGRHSRLMDPAFASAHIRHTRAMVVAYRRRKAA